MLSDIGIRREIENKNISIEPFHEKYLRGASYTLRLGNKISVFSNSFTPIDLSNEESFPNLHTNNISSELYKLHGNEFVLGGTIERISLSRGFSATLKNLSGLSRIGLAVEIASFISPGFGEDFPKPLTLEIRNFSDIPILLRPEIPICHILFWKLNEFSSQSYDRDERRHSISEAPAPSRYFKYFKKTGK